MKTIYKTEILSNSKITQKLEQVETKTKSNLMSREIYNEAYGFTVDTEQAIYVESENYNSYTFAITREEDNGLVENLFLSLQADGSYKVFLVSYDLTQEEKEAIINDNYLDLNFNNKVSWQEIYIDPSELLQRSLYYGDGIYYDEDLGYCYNEVQVVKSRATGWSVPERTVIDCPEDIQDFINANAEGQEGGGNGETTTDTTDTPTGDGTYGPTDMSGGGDGTNAEGTGTTNETEPESTDPANCLQVDENGNCIENVTSPLIPNSNNCDASDNSFNDYYSRKSPFDVDLTALRQSCDSISTADVENEKFLCIYEKLSQSLKFKDLFIDTFGESGNLNVKFELDDSLPNNVGGNTGADPLNPSTLVDGVLRLNLIIKINKNHLDSTHISASSTIAIARDILHECIHAFLYVKKYSCNDGTTLDYLNNQLLGELLNEYYDGSCSQYQEQHEFMLDYMLPTIIEILKDVKNNLIPEDNQSQVIGLDYNNSIAWPNNPLTESHIFDWDEFFENISIAGLHETSVFQQEIASDTIKNYLFYRYAGGSGTITEFSKSYCND